MDAAHTRGRSRNFKRGGGGGGGGGGPVQFTSKGGGGGCLTTQFVFANKQNLLKRGGGGIRIHWAPPWICPCIQTSEQCTTEATLASNYEGGGGGSCFFLALAMRHNLVGHLIKLGGHNELFVSVTIKRNHQVGSCMWKTTELMK